MSAFGKWLQVSLGCWNDSIKAMLNRLVAEDHRPALERQAEEHHRQLRHNRPEQGSAKINASSGPWGALLIVQPTLSSR